MCEKKKKNNILELQCLADDLGNFLELPIFINASLP